MPVVLGQQTDHQLIALYLEGKESAFEELLNRHKAKIYTSIYLFVKDQDLADDIFQEVFIKIIDTLRKGKYNHEGKFVQWAMRISYNLCVDYFRRDKRRPTISGTDDFNIFDVIRQPDDNIEDLMIKSQTHDKIRKLVDMLPAASSEAGSYQLRLTVDRQGAKQVLQNVCLHPFNFQSIPAGDRFKLICTCGSTHLCQPALELINSLFGCL